jgi:hypothetical protein
LEPYLEQNYQVYQDNYYNIGNYWTPPSKTSTSL